VGAKYGLCAQTGVSMANTPHPPKIERPRITQILWCCGDFMLCFYYIEHVPSDDLPSNTEIEMKAI